MSSEVGEITKGKEPKKKRKNNNTRGESPPVKTTVKGGMVSRGLVGCDLHVRFGI